MTITFKGTTIADDSAARSGVSALKSRAQGNIQSSPGVDKSAPLIEGRGNRVRSVTFLSKMQHESVTAALDHWDDVSDFPGTDGDLVIGGHTHHAGCRMVECEPFGCKTIATYEFEIGEDPA